jgi:hypothetical protein
MNGEMGASGAQHQFQVVDCRQEILLNLGWHGCIQAMAIMGLWIISASSIMAVELVQK